MNRYEQDNTPNNQNSYVGQNIRPNIRLQEAPGLGIYSGRESSIGDAAFDQQDNRSIGSTPSKISKFTYSEYPQIRPTNPLYTSTHTIKTSASHASRASTMNTVSRRQKYNPNAPRRLYDWRWVGALAVLLFFPTGIIAFGLAFKARTKFKDGFIDEAKKLNNRAYALCVVSFCLGVAWILTAFFAMDQWPRTNG
ncbi:hypothetical protein BpHYR1_036716 [Brachionus plicatilis]|uniref:Uncharacterized protein n=1 Tax=Brachionus plicatilis TaxID=10195 RepID=A0A3M7RKM9_BRAPC|nr:hypothetical protein BpHYR1_036716 [Brachionus plicatilis]